MERHGRFSFVLALLLLLASSLQLDTLFRTSFDFDTDWAASVFPPGPPFSKEEDDTNAVMYKNRNGSTLVNIIHKGDAESKKLHPATTKVASQMKSSNTSLNTVSAKDTSHSPASRGKILQPYVNDPVCPSCYFQLTSRNIRCGERLHRAMKRKNLLLESAALFVAGKFPRKCGMCDPSSCSDHDKRLWRLDAKAPRVLSATSHFLTSLSDEYRVPREATHDLDGYFSSTENIHPTRTYLFEYNPSIIQIPKQQVPQMEAENPVYLASFRLSNIQQCITGSQELQMIGGSWPRPKALEYGGFALLRADLSIITDTVVDFRSTGEKYVQDIRLFVLSDNIYLSTYDEIFPLWLVRPTNETHDIVTLTQLSPSDMILYSRPFRSCAPFPRRRGVSSKNLSYFMDKETGKAMVEKYPMGDKHPVDLHSPCKKVQEAPRNNGVSTAQPEASFATQDVLHFVRQGVFKPPYTSDRGSSCCATIQDPSGKELLLGISHSKTRFKGSRRRNSLTGNVGANMFFSSFYAMEPSFPYYVVARTGRFCFGFPRPSEIDMNPYARLNLEQLAIGETYDCPRIHFVSGLVEKADDSSRLIVAYGVNDCSPRMVEVQKSDVVAMLFPQQSELDETEKNVQ